MANICFAERVPENAWYVRKDLCIYSMRAYFPCEETKGGLGLVRVYIFYVSFFGSVGEG